MGVKRLSCWVVAAGFWLAPSLLGPVADGAIDTKVSAQQPRAAEVTFARDVAPILQRSCQNCHRPNGVAPMSLVTYEEVRPWARAIKTRTGIGPRAGVMPPWYVEKNIGIQHYKDDPSLSDDEVAIIARWADAGAPLGNPADMPPAKDWGDDTVWRIGKPDIIVKTKDIVVKANAPD
jgi:mono/diheme cytochrome c family protein